MVPVNCKCIIWPLAWPFRDVAGTSLDVRSPVQPEEGRYCNAPGSGIMCHEPDAVAGASSEPDKSRTDEDKDLEQFSIIMCLLPADLLGTRWGR